jgi:Transposase DDE domain group 1
LNNGHSANGAITRMSQDTEQRVLFEGVLSKPTVAQFDGGSLSSDGGAILLGSLDRGIGLTRALCAGLVDDRDPRRVLHSLEELLRQRVYGLGLGYCDCNDAARLRDDPLLRPVCSTSGKGSKPLASQPSLSRFENSIGGRQVIEMERRLESFVMDRLKHRHRKAKRITIDLDPTDDPTHGQQAFSFFNGHYDCWCFLPLVGFLSIDDDPQQYLFHARLRPGNARAARCAPGLLRRCVREIRRRWPKATIRVRLDGGYATPWVLQTLEELRVEYLVGMPENSRLSAQSKGLLRQARRLAKKAGRPVQLFDECDYRARSWPRDRRVIYKAEVVTQEGRDPKDNVRYVVTNLRNAPARVYEIYRQRGDVENRIKELHHGLSFDRTSCSSYVANQVRIVEAAAAFVLFQELRARMRGSELRTATVETIREKLLKVAVRVVESVRRIVLSFPESYPWKELWCQTAVSAGGLRV